MPSTIRSCALCLCLLVNAVQRGQAASTGPPDSLVALTGVFRTGAAHDIAIVPFRAGTGWTLLLADVLTDQLRLLSPAGKDVYTAGSELAPSPPTEWTLRFPSASMLIVEPAGTNPRFTATRIPIETVPVSFHSGALRLEGSLYRPAARGTPLPLIALAHGSEDNDRYSFGPIPLALAAQGYAVLAYDKRGTGASTGDWSSAGLEELADDLVAGIVAMSRRGDIDTTRISVLGTSEGGWVAPIAASRLPSIKAIAAISGGARTKGDAYIYKVRREAEASGRSVAAVDSATREADELIVESVKRVKDGASPSGFDRRIAYDPNADWRRFKGPVLCMGGEADVLESGPEAAAWFRRLFVQSGNVDATVRLWPRAHHSLLLGVTGDPSEFRSLKGIKQLAPGYWDVLLHWFEGHAF